MLYRSPTFICLNILKYIMLLYILLCHVKVEINIYPKEALLSESYNLIVLEKINFLLFEPMLDLLESKMIRAIQ